MKMMLLFQYRWKNILWKFTKTCIFIVLLYFSYIGIIKPTIQYIYPEKPIAEKVMQYPDNESMNLDNYLTQIAYMEARNDSSARRPGSQFWGLYQIGTTERRNAGYGDISWEVYCKHPEIQKLCMIKHLKNNKKYLNNEIKKYSGKVVDGILMTESGILALAHLGTGYAKACLRNGKIPNDDGNGNNGRLYAKLGGYHLNLDNY